MVSFGGIGKWLPIHKLKSKGVEMKPKVKETLGYVINAISIAVFFFLLNVLDVSLDWPYLEYIGWIIFGLGVFLIVASFLTLVRNRGKGLIDWGIYSIVRHPMYMGAILVFLSWAFLLPHWLTLLLSLIKIAIVYGFVLQADQRNIELFGSEYEEYSERVPRLNFLAGFLKSLRRA
jgi:protein-S-isoprenylcysteine O-methyltransferase Ste14